MAPKKLKYELEDLLKVRETSQDTADVVRKISKSECGGRILRSSSDSTVGQRRARTVSIITNSYDEGSTEHFEYRSGKFRRSERLSKYSPTPSIKRGKAERLLKEHGSPPGIRVTAGGRIVPDGLSLVSSPHIDAGQRSYFGYGNRAYGFAPYLAPKPMNGYVVNLGNGSFAQVIDGILRPVEERNGMLHLFMPAPNLPVPPITPLASVGSSATNPSCPQQCLGPFSALADSNVLRSTYLLPTARELQVMELVHAKLEQELKDLNRNEVLQRGSLTAAKRQDIVKNRIALTERIDQSRRAITDSKKILDEGHQLGHPHISDLNFLATHGYDRAKVAYDEPQISAQQFHLDPNGCPLGAKQPHGQMLMPDIPEFVPRHHNATGGTDYASTIHLLQERSGNVDNLRNVVPASTSYSTRDRNSDIEKNHRFSKSRDDMGLDGSANNVQPRRSHAIAIKNPNASSLVGELSSKIPAHGSQNASEHLQREDGASGNLEFAPSPDFVPEMKNMVQSPKAVVVELDNTSHQSQRQSASSVNTEDFFPQNAAEHSSSKFKSSGRPSNEDGISWMKDNTSKARNDPSTPARLPNKFVFNDDSPADRYFATIADAVSTSKQTEVKPVGQDWQLGIAKETDGDIGCQMFDRLMPKGTDQCFGMIPITGVKKSEAYYEGYRLGIQQGVMCDSKDQDFRVGYRDGLLQSSHVSKYVSSEIGAIERDKECSLSIYPPTDTVKVSNAMTISTDIENSRKSEIMYTNSTEKSPLARVPANSLATTPTPTPTNSIKIMRTTALDTSLEPPSARLDFMSRPKMNDLASSVRVNDTQTSSSPFPDADSGSPVAKRRTEYGTDTDLKYVTSAMRERGESFDQQRFAKSAPTSSVQTYHHARGVFPHYDGLTEAVTPTAYCAADVEKATSPSANSEKKGKMPSSPIKRRTSAAVATMKQVASISAKREDPNKEDGILRKLSKREQDGMKNASPEKKQWHERWTKNFRQ